MDLTLFMLVSAQIVLLVAPPLLSIFPKMNFLDYLLVLVLDLSDLTLQILKLLLEAGNLARSLQSLIGEVGVGRRVVDLTRVGNKVLIRARRGLVARK